MNASDKDYFKARPDFPYRLRAWSEGDPKPFIGPDVCEVVPALFDGYVLTTVIRQDGEMRVIWIDPVLHNRGVIRTEQILDVLMTRPEKWEWSRGMGMLKPTLFTV
jgi:hypothetical protein